MHSAEIGNSVRQGSARATRRHLRATTCLGALALLLSPLSGSAFAACTISGGAYTCSGAGDLNLDLPAGLQIFANIPVTVFNPGSGSTVIDSAADLVGNDAGIAVQLLNGASDLSIRQTAGSISGFNAIAVDNSGVGRTIIEASGNLIGNAGIYVVQGSTASDVIIRQFSGTISGSDAIHVENNGIGTTQIETAGEILGYDAVHVELFGHTSNLIFRQLGGAITGDRYGIFVDNGGIGSSFVDVAGSVQADSDTGIYVYNRSTAHDLTIRQTAGSIRGDLFGIQTFNTGTGATLIDVAGSVSSNDTAGISAFNDVTATDLVIRQRGGSIVGDEYGIKAVNTGTGATRIDIAGSVSGGGTGLYVDAPGSVTNIWGLVAGGDKAIDYLQNGNRLNLYSSARVTGPVFFSGTTDNTINVVSGSRSLDVYAFPLADHNTIQLGTATQSLIFQDFDPYKGNGKIVVVDTAAASLGSAVAGSYGGSVLGLVGEVRGLEGARPALGGQPLGYAEPEAKPNPTDIQAGPAGSGLSYDAYGNLVWLRGLAEVGARSADAAQVGWTSGQYGLFGGIDHAYDDMRLGVFGGGGQSVSTLRDDTGSVHADIGVVGAYLRKSFGATSIDATAMGGYLATETERRINGGTETASGHFDGWMAAGELALSTRYALGRDLSLTPTLATRYMASVAEGYSETGSSQDVSYDGHTSQAIEPRLDLRLAYAPASTDGHDVTYWLKGGTFLRQALGNTSASASVLGTDLDVRSLTDRTTYGGTAGLGFEARISAGATVFGSLNGTLASDNTRSATLQGGVKIAF